jgi:hypothetical protein
MNPKGMRTVQIPLANGDAIHVYSDECHIWLQLRRAIPTEQDIARPSFKVAFDLSSASALALAGELLTAASRRTSNQKAKNPKSPPAKSL